MSMAIEWVIACTVLGVILGVGIGWLIGRNRPSGKTRLVELEAALVSARDELAEYKQTVVGEFAETADKFRALDESYHQLHRQLATSAAALCGDAGSALLTGPSAATEQLVEAAEEDVISSEADVTEVAPDAETDGVETDQVDTNHPETEGIDTDHLATDGAEREADIIVGEVGSQPPVDDFDEDRVPTLTDTAIVTTAVTEPVVEATEETASTDRQSAAS